jgi:hypothetical protein
MRRGRAEVSGMGMGILDLLEPWRFTHLLIGPGVGRRMGETNPIARKKSMIRPGVLRVV